MLCFQLLSRRARQKIWHQAACTASDHAKEMALFEVGPLEQKRITAEACVHHLFSAPKTTSSAALSSNAIRRSKLWRSLGTSAVAEDRIDVIATDHAPHTLEEKGRKYAARGFTLGPACAGVADGAGRRRHV